MKTPKIIKDENNIIDVEILEQAICDISKAIKNLYKSRLTERSIVTLIHDHIPKGNGTGKRNIIDVLHTIHDLDMLVFKQVDSK